MSDQNECYFCGNPANTVEHVPPRCLFPESKDVLGHDLRKNLITVPSCEIHNSNKSDDDEFLMFSLCGIVGSGPAGDIQRWKKVERARLRRKWELTDVILQKIDDIEVIEQEDGSLKDVYWGAPKIDRLKKCFEHIARGIHLHHYGFRFIGEVNSHLEYLVKQTGNMKSDYERFDYAIERDYKDMPSFGSNPIVFSYQASEKDRFGLYGFRFRFYEGLRVCCSFFPENTVIPEHPLEALIAKGEPFYWEENGKIFLYNATPDEDKRPESKQPDQ